LNSINKFGDGGRLFPNPETQDSHPQSNRVLATSSTSLVEPAISDLILLNMAFWMTGCLYGASSVMLGAFGAHGLKSRISDPARIANWGTAAHYQRFKFMGPVTPLGGVCLIGGWVALAFGSRGRVKL
ncbi:hypothetical protein D0865_10750, partial [Hortaea werneckii]